jgi:hypothetical protein
MNHRIWINIGTLFVLFLGSGGVVPDVSQASQPDPAIEAPKGEMPPRPIPVKPIPHHEPGRPSKAAQYTSQVNQINAQGVEQIITLTGLDALLDEGIITDPLAGNDRLVNLDNILFSSFTNFNSFALQTFNIVTPTLQAIPGSQIALGPYAFNDIAAADLNADGQSEQIAAWVGSDGIISLSIGEMPSLDSRVSSVPAALALSDGTGDLVVRGYDDALWHAHYDGSTWGTWNNTGGGFLLSAPAIVSQAPGQFDVFAIGADNLTYQRHWAAGVFTGTWQLVDTAGYWPELERVVPTPEMDAPAVVARSGGRLDLFRRGPDNTLRWRLLEDATWENWQSLGGFLTSAPAAVSYGTDGIFVIGRGLDDALWYRFLTGKTWGRWERLEMPAGITAASAPTVAYTPAGQMNLYMRGSDDALWQIQYTNAGWGDWVSGGGLLGSGVGAAVWNSHSELFAQNKDGTLQHKDGQAGWEAWNNLQAQVSYETESVAVLPGNPVSLENFLIDIDTGYFTGDGRQQIVLAYQAPNYQIKVDLYDIQNGFMPTKLAGLSTPIAGWAPRVVAGDVDGDGIDDIVVARLLPNDSYRYKVTAYHVQKDGNGIWTGDILAGKSSPTFYSYFEVAPLGGFSYWFAGTMRLAAGDLDGDLHDEVVVLSDWGDSVVYNDYALLVQLYIFDNDYVNDVGQCLLTSGEPACMRAEGWGGESDDDNFWDDGQATGLGLAVGDVNFDGVDEIILTWPTGFDGSDWPDLKRKLRILDASDVDADTFAPVQLAEWPVPGYQRYSFLDTLAVGDLDRDLVDEIIFYTPDSLSVYDYNRYVKSITQIAFLGSGSGFGNPNGRSIKMATGDFTAESLRVGPPTYRLQRSTGEIIAILNQPPRHSDTLNGAEYDINSTDTETYAAYENKQSQSTEMSLQVQRDWGFASGTEWNVGDPEGTHVKDSMDKTYGEHFEKSVTTFKEVAFGSEVKATSDDIVYYAQKDLQVWEYPIYEDNSRTPASYMMVVFPLPGISNSGTEEFFETGNSTCDFWYAPEHQINNVWSYASSSNQLKDFDSAKGVLNTLQTVTVGPTVGEFWTGWQSITTTQQSSSINQGVETMFEGQIGGDSFDVSAEPFGVGVAYEVHLPYVKSTSKFSYSTGTLSTAKLVGTNATTIRVHFNPIDASGIYNYQVTPYLYWSKEGYLVLDYLTAPKKTTFWDRYNLPDPAFILPWTDGHCAGKEQFSKDITASPPFASNGETVTLTATVHNFSNVPADNVRVRFYLGEPSDKVQIGSDQLVNLPARGKVDVSVPWQASGMGEQRIYAVIDPGYSLMEMHDETTNPENDNNVAFGVVAMGDSGFVDPGAQTYFDYRFLTYTDTQSIPTNVFIPTGIMTETLRIEMTPLSSHPKIRHGFSLVAYKGGTERDLPWDLSFNPIPAAIWFRYSNKDVAGLDENKLTLYRYDRTQGSWVDAACGEYQRYPEGNWMLVPICQTGDFALLSSYTGIFLPYIMK